jgi:hypothetical protein
VNALQQYLFRAASELGLRIEVDHVVTLADGRAMRSQALFPDLGNVSGTLVFSFDDPMDRSAREELKARAYAMSTMGVSGQNSTFDIQSFIETCSDWGWVGDPSKIPSWMKSRPQISYH